MSENNPAPDRYDTITSFRQTTAKSIPVSFKSRIGGTQISNKQSTGMTNLPLNNK